MMLMMADPPKHRKPSSSSPSSAASSHGSNAGKHEDLKPPPPPPLLRKPAPPSSKSSNKLPSSVKTGLHLHHSGKAITTSSSGRPSLSLASTSKNRSSKHITEKKEKKVYELPGQKHDPPDEREPLRIFYQSLYQENPRSEMAQFWMMEHGLLELEAAKKAMERKKKSQLAQKLGLPTKVSIQKTDKSTPKTTQRSNSISNGSSKPVVNMKRKSDHDSDDDLIIKPKKKSNT